VVLLVGGDRAPDVPGLRSPATPDPISTARKEIVTVPEAAINHLDPVRTQME
jgi:hypothetical protein